MSPRPGPDTLDGAVQHRLAEVDQRDIQIRKQFQKLQRVVTSAAAHIDQILCRRRDRSRCLRDQLHR